MSAASSLSPLALMRSSVPARILQRGEDYFRSGAVFAVQRRGDRAGAQVQGSSEEPYEVQLRWGPAGVEATCTCPYDWSDVCKHAVAAAWALEPPRPAAVSAELVREGDPIDAEAARQRELRAKVARKEPFRVARGAKGFAGALRLLSEKHGHLYEVLVGSDGFAWCTCPDFRTNELGTCKHIEYARRARKSAPVPPVVVVGARDSRGAVLDPLRDLCLSPAAQEKLGLGRKVDAQGYWRGPDSQDVLARVKAARAALTGRRGVQVHSEVLELLDRVEEQERTRRKGEAFAEAVRVSLAGKGKAPAAWTRLVEALQVRLHPYQVEGVLFAVRTRRALLADDMGLGKTLQSIAAARLLMEQGEVARTVVVCPASLKHQWKKEIAKMLGAGVEAAVVEGGRRDREALYRTSKAAFWILNYELLIKDLPLLRAAAPDLVVVDEAQRIKNWNTKTAKAVKGLPSPRVLVLTGTPMENRLAELHSVAEHLEPRVLGPMWRLMPEFARTEIKHRKPVVLGFQHLDLVRARLAPHFLRRERSLVLDQLPPRTDQLFPVPFTVEQQAVHQDHAANAARIASKKHLTEADVLRLMAEMTSMRMIANGMLLYEWEKVENTVRAGRLPAELLSRFPSPKLTEFAQVLEELLAQKGTKVVVFSQWERMLRLAAAATHQELAEVGARPLFFHGQLSSKERAEVIADFHEDPAARVFFSTDAGGVGLNLQEAANTVVHLEAPWNPAVLEQRVGRVHRMGQKKPIQVVSLISQNCIESRIAAVVEQKRALFDGLFREGSDEVRFDDETRTSLVDRVKEILGDADSAAAAAKQAGTSLVEMKRPVDAEIRQAKEGVADLAASVPAEPKPSGAVATGLQLPAGAAPVPAAPEEAAGEAQLQVDLGAVASGLLGLLGMPRPPQAASLPVTVRRAAGRIHVELPEVPEAAWQHLSAFAAALSAAGQEPKARPGIE